MEDDKEGPLASEIGDEQLEESVNDESFVEVADGVDEEGGLKGEDGDEGRYGVQRYPAISKSLPTEV